MPTTDEHLEQTTVEMDNQVHLLTEQVDALRSMLAQYVTRDELQLTLLDSITKQLTTRLDGIDTAGEQRHAEFVRHYEQRLESLATKTELAGVITASAENTNRLTVLETSSSTSIATLEKRLDKVEDKQLTLDASIREIRGDTEKTATSAEGMRTTFAEFLDDDKKRRGDIDRDITTLKNTQVEDAKALRSAQEDVLSNRSELNDLKADIATQVTTTRRNVEEIKGTMQTVEARSVEAESRLTTAELIISTLNAKLSAFLWFFSDKDGRKMGGVLLGIFFFTQISALYLLYRIATAGILAR